MRENPQRIIVIHTDKCLASADSKRQLAGRIWAQADCLLGTL